MPLYLGPHQIGECQRCGLKFLRAELVEDDYVRNLLVCEECYDPDHPQLYPPVQKKEGIAPLRPAPFEVAITPPVLTGTIVSNDADLDWTESLSNHSLITGYELYRALGDPAGLIPGDYELIDSSFVEYDMFGAITDNPLSYLDDETDFNSEFYFYYVVGIATDAQAVSNVIVMATPPNPPVLSLAFSSDAQHRDLSWTASTAPVIPVTGYRLWQSLDHGDYELLTTIPLGDPREYTVEVNEEAHRYDYYVEAFAEVNVPGIGVISLPSNIVTIHKVAPVIVVLSNNNSQYGLISRNPGTWEVLPDMPAHNIMAGLFIDDFDAEGGLFLAGGQGQVLHSRTAETWIKTTAGIPVVCISIRTQMAYSPEQRRVVWVGDSGIAYSDDGGHTWTSSSVPPGLSPAGVIWSPVHSLFIFGSIAVAGGSGLATSPDGVTWTPRNTNNLSCYALAVNEVGLIVCQRGADAQAYTSTDGITYGAGTTTPLGGWANEAYGNGVFACCDQSLGGRATASADGISWLSQQGFNGAQTARIKFSERRSRFYSSSSASPTPGSVVMSSSSGVDWALETTPAQADSLSWLPIIPGFAVID